MELFNFAKTVPEWMNQSYFEKVVRHLEKDLKAVVLDLNVAAGRSFGRDLLIHFLLLRHVLYDVGGYGYGRRNEERKAANVSSPRIQRDHSR